jgi:hypothetical protein
MIYIDPNIAKSLLIELRFTLRLCLHCRSHLIKPSTLARHLWQIDLDYKLLYIELKEKSRLHFTSLAYRIIM